MKFTVLFSAVVIAGLLPAQATTQNAAAQTNANPEAAMTALFGDPAVVKGKGFEIKRSELDQVVSAARSTLVAANQPIPPQLEILTLEQLITIQTLLQTATPADQASGKIEADQQYTNLLSQFRSIDEFMKLLKAKGMTVEELRVKATQEAVARAALKRALNINITDEEAKDYYNQHPADFEQPEMVHAQHILLMTSDPSTRPPTPLSTNTVAQKRRQIEEIRKRILGGEEFSTLAKQYSEDTGTKERGGELPMFARGQMVPEFESAAFALATNQVSDVVTTQYGYHLIKVLEKVPAKKLDFAAEANVIKDGLAGQKIRKLAPALVKKLRQDEKVEIQDANLKSEDEQIELNQEAAAAADSTGTTNK